jgi:hypothetical protein
LPPCFHRLAPALGLGRPLGFGLALSLLLLAYALGFGRPLGFGLALLLLLLACALGFGRPLGLALALLLLLLACALGFSRPLGLALALLLLLLACALGFGRPLRLALALLLLLLACALGFGLALPFRFLLVLPESRPAVRQSESQCAHQHRAKWPPHKSLHLLPARLGQLRGQPIKAPRSGRYAPCRYLAPHQTDASHKRRVPHFPDRPGNSAQATGFGPSGYPPPLDRNNGAPGGGPPRDPGGLFANLDFRPFLPGGFRRASDDGEGQFGKWFAFFAQGHGIARIAPDADPRIEGQLG